jgi:hypothetical protein
MKQNESHNHPPEGDSCPRVRLAKSAIAAVDACQCGMLQLHLGAITIRMTPPALAELEATLRAALREHSERFGEEEEEHFESFLVAGRGARGAA